MVYSKKPVVFEDNLLVEGWTRKEGVTTEDMSLCLLISQYVDPSPHTDYLSGVLGSETWTTCNIPWRTPSTRSSKRAYYNRV